ncbi:hypothetical protein BV25DRAFT_1921194 [Artomyces pyxidatus]|uniref:Uncharacterized protein n=1 Tax=Artomyces pyxidatus TaxID=48021 RepID=A0ACB8SI36_9AGAM|nr:hypothetical protein BV25DRAFT_1921194 [Artomyces pyxidatus]
MQTSQKIIKSLGTTIELIDTVSEVSGFLELEHLALITLTGKDGSGKASTGVGLASAAAATIPSLNTGTKRLQTSSHKQQRYMQHGRSLRHVQHPSTYVHAPGINKKAKIVYKLKDTGKTREIKKMYHQFPRGVESMNGCLDNIQAL